MANVIEHRKFIAVDPVANNNKYWNYTVLDDGTVRYNWGRVGGSDATKTFPLTISTLSFPFDMKVIYDESQLKNLKKRVNSSERDFLSKVYEKTHKKAPEPSYTEITIVGGEAEPGRIQVARPVVNGKISNEEIKKLAVKEIAGACPITAGLVKRLAEANRHELVAATGGIANGGMDIDLETGIVRTAMGVVTLEAVKKARLILDQMIPFVKMGNTDDATYTTNLGLYLRLVPQATPRTRGWHRDWLVISKQTSLLDQIETSIEIAEQRMNDAINAANKAAGKPVAAPSVFECKLTLCNDTKVWDRVKTLYYGSRNMSHASSSLKPVKIYEVHIPHMAAAFEADGKKVGNVKLLWHGTRMFNVLSILKRGFVLPTELSSAQTTGAMFGNGVYFSEQSTKSLNYATGWWAGTRDRNSAFMFLCNVAMGKEYVPTSACNGKRPGYDSCHAIAHRSGVMNDEQIVYRTSQTNIQYLVEFE